MRSFNLKLKKYELKIVKNDAKFEEGLTFPFKVDMRNLTNFDLST